MNKLKYKLWNPKTKSFIKDYKEANKLSLGTGGTNKHLCTVYATAPDCYLTFCLFTGQQDSYGNDMHIGDIIEFSDGAMVILEFEEQCSKYITHQLKKYEFPRVHYCLYPNFVLAMKPKVIGNIYENPSLYGERAQLEKENQK